MNTSRILSLCISCAKGIYGNRPPSEHYAARVARLLAGTAAVESGISERRQHGFSATTIKGAWGLWQTEIAALRDSLAYVQARPALMRRCGEWLFEHNGGDFAVLYGLADAEILRLLATWDRLACLVARLHYLRIPSAIPEDLTEQARYWKKYYNTRLGKGTPGKYIDAWEHMGLQSLPWGVEIA